MPAAENKKVDEKEPTSKVIVTADTPIRRLIPQDSIVPNVLYGTNSVLIPTPKADAFERTTLQVYRLFKKRGFPSWMDQFPASIIMEVSELLRTGFEGDDKVPQWAGFRPDTRMDDFTFVAEPQEESPNQLQIFTISNTQILNDSSGSQLVKALREYANGVKPGMPSYFETRWLKTKDFPENIRVHLPRFLLVETLRIVSAFSHIDIGDPAGSVCLMPNETRDITVKNKSTVQTTTKDKKSVLEKISEQTVRDFQQDFSNTTKTSREVETSWSATRNANLTNGTISTTSGGKTTLTDVVDQSFKTLEKLNETRSRSIDITVSKEYEKVLTEEKEETRLTKIANPTNECITFLYHHINNVHCTHFDLLDAEIVFTGDQESDTPVVFRINDELKTTLKSIFGDAKAVEIYNSISALINERYGPLKLMEKGRLSLAYSNDIADPNVNINSRKAMVEQPRRFEGPLPLCLRSRIDVLKTEGIHVIPYLAQYSSPPKTGT